MTRWVGLGLLGFGCADGAGAPQEAQEVFACRYFSPFDADGSECREYLGDWTRADAEADCLGETDAVFEVSGCGFADELGRCEIVVTDDQTYQIVFDGTDPAVCEGLELGCEVFGGGTFLPDVPCEGLEDDDFGSGGEAVFVQPTLECVDPLAGEPAGQSADDQVCTWQAIGGCVEEGRRFSDYASCDVVLTQRPYYPIGADPFVTPVDDPVLADPAFQEELAWVTSQVESCGCICCHSEETAPLGPSNWYVEAEGIWTDTMFPTGLAMGAGWIDTSLLGAYPPDDNNGFDRSVTGLPTTDVPRMVAFFEAELARRGYTEADFADTDPGPDIFYQQAIYEPEPCAEGQGVDADGSVQWTGGSARYVYVLEDGSDNPGVPPNLDEPVGTLWLAEVSWDEAPMDPGLPYGVPAAPVTQRIPAVGPPPDLVASTPYVIYVLRDVGVPITRCTFTIDG